MRQQPSYRIVAIESRRSRGGAYLESLGFYDPRRKLLTLNLERADHWLSTGAQPTDVTRKLISRYRREHPEPGEAPAGSVGEPAAGENEPPTKNRES